MTRAAVKVLAFAGARDIVGQAEVLLELADGVGNAGALMDQLCQRYPLLSEYRGSIRIAINGQYVEAHEPVAAGDEVALIPPVAGG